MSFAIFAKAVSTSDGFLRAVHAGNRARAINSTIITDFKFRIDFTSVLPVGFGDPRLDLATHIVSTASIFLYRRCPMNIPEDGANLASGIKSQPWQSYLLYAEFEVKLTGSFLRR